MAKITVTIGGQEHVLEAKENAPLREALLRGGFPITAPCGGNGACGKCKVRVSGAAEPDARETEVLSPDELARGVRLACRTAVRGGMRVHLDGARAMQIETGVRIPEVALNKTGFVAAVDIGTTTVAMYLYDAPRGEALAVESAANVQQRFGADVITRIQYAMEHGGGLTELQKAICAQVEDGLAAMLARAGVPAAALREIVVTGNTTMLHLFLGRPVNGIAVAPFMPDFLDAQHLTGRDIGLACAPDAAVVTPPCIAAYVGADTVTAALASGIQYSDVTCLLIDIGTNGEMALGGRNGLTCCSTAAGPAFEGACISRGMGGTAGAISEVRVADGDVDYAVIGGGAPMGLCGSGIIDAAAEMVRTGVIDETGRLDEDAPFVAEIGGEPAFMVAHGIGLTQKDVRQIQLAKAAIAAGIASLLRQRGLTPDGIDVCFVAGGFGSYMNPESAIRIGLLPDALRGKIRVLGNAAAAGAVMCALDDSCKAECERIRGMCEYIELSTLPAFQDEYVNQMFF